MCGGNFRAAGDTPPMIYLEMVRPFDVKNIFRLVFSLVFMVALLFAEVRRGNISVGYITPNFSRSANNFNQLLDFRAAEKNS